VRPALREGVAGSRAAAELAALVRESVSAGVGREVLHLRLASLAPGLRRPHHRRLLRDALAPALGSARSRVFDLPNGDVVAVAPPPAPGFVTAAEALLRALEGAGGAGAAVRRLRLPDSAAQLLTAAAESLGLEPARPPPALPAPAEPPPGTADLAAAERALAAADLDALTLAQSVCRMDPEGDAPQPAWEDRRVAWPALAARLLPGRDLGAAPALARRLARAAEARMLAELTRPAALMAWRPVGLTLSPAVLEGAAFARFADALPAGRAGGITIGLRPAELLADPGLAARIGVALRGRGFRLALDDAEPGLVALLAPGRLGLDVIRLRWSPALPGAMPAAVKRLLEDAADRVVLAGVDRPAAIAWGWEAGIRLFQGPLVERRRRAV
jgi:hypothetical protein